MMKRLLPTCLVLLLLPLVASPAGRANDTSVVTIAGSVRVPRQTQATADPPTVELLVEPRWDVQRAAEITGTPVSMLSVAQQRAAPSFALPLDLSALPPGFVAAEGYANVLVAVRSGDRVATWGTTVWPDDTVVQVPAIDMSKGVVPPGLGGAYAASMEPQAAPCLTIIWGAYNGPYQTKIMDVMNPPAIRGRGSYFHGGSTATTLGFLTGGPTTWSVGGTMTSSSSAGSGFDVPAQNERIQALWMYRERAVVCVGNQNVPYNYYGKGNQPSITHVKHTNCGGIYGVGSRYTHTYNDNQTYSAGLTVYGINLSSQAGYSSTASLRFTFDVRGRVCGNSPTLGESSPRVDAQKV